MNMHEAAVSLFRVNLFAYLVLDNTSVFSNVLVFKFIYSALNYLLYEFVLHTVISRVIILPSPVSNSITLAFLNIPRKLEQLNHSQPSLALLFCL